MTKKFWLPLLFAVAALAAEPTAELAPLPTEITLTNKAVIRKIERVIRWDKGAVVVKHAGGIDSIRFDYMSPESRKIWEGRSKIASVEQGKLNALVRAKDAAVAQAQADSVAREQKFEEAIRRKSVMVGMTREQAAKAWGEPDKKNISGGAYGSTEQWVYRGSGQYLYFDDGLVRSWQSSK